MATAVLRHTVVIWPLSTNDRDKLKLKLTLFVAELSVCVPIYPI